MNKLIVAAAAALAFVFALPVSARDKREPLQVALKVPPPPTSKQQAANLPSGAPARSIGLRVEDRRGGTAGAVIGQGTSDNEVLFPILATSDIDQYVDGVTRQIVGSWGIDTAGARDGTLLLRYTQLNATHSGRAVGATYIGEVKLNYVLANRSGKTVAEGSVSGYVDHYGKGRSVENVNEALADALRDAMTKLLNENGFRKIWADSFTAVSATPAGGDRTAASGRSERPKKGAGAASTKSIEARLQRLEELYAKGTITKDEYDRQRAAIVGEL